MNVLKVYDTNLDRIRLGESGDGGYVIFDGLKYDYLLSGGIENTIRFESDFIDKYNVVCDAFDNSIDELPEKNNKIRFNKKTISGGNNVNTTNLKHIIKQKKNIFVKMDIEGWEWNWLSQLTDEDFNNIKQMCIELHFFHNVQNANDVQVFHSRLQILDRLNQFFFLMHVHANNFGPSFDYNSTRYPSVIECTYINKSVFKENPNLVLIENVRSFPTELDEKNCEQIEDINDLLNKEPFRATQLRKI